ncbi:MAG: SIS domain-containing protein [Acidobacteria bacterium]|nr:SIS domain-containing protein [Acidobacteriota bacterium]
MSKMLEEIRQQPSALERTFRSEWKGVEKLKARFAKSRPKFIILAARGTSDNAAQFGRYLLEIATGIPVSLAAPSIFTLYGARVDYKDALVVALSQSGESTDTNIVLERARECGAFTVGITNEASSSLAKIAEHVFLVRAGRERSVAATKTYTGQLLSMYLLAYALGAPVSLDELRAMPEAVSGALMLEAEIREKAGRYRFMENAVVVGRGLNYANAFEWALKLMETCYVVAERFSSADFLHGPIAMVEQSFPVFLFAPAGVTWPSIREMIGRVHQLGAETLLITDQSNREAASMKGTRTIVLPSPLHRRSAVPEELYTPLPYIIPAQILAACLAEEKGLNPDQPRALEKVTRTL